MTPSSPPAWRPVDPGPAARARTALVQSGAGALLALLAGCGSAPLGEPPLMRHGSVLVEGCTLDGWQRATLAGEPARRALREVVLLCLSVHEDGQVRPGPADASARTALGTEIDGLRQLGYEVSLGVTSRGDDGVDYPPERIGAWLRQKPLRDQATAAIASLVTAGRGASGLDVALPQLPDGARGDLGAWVGELATALRPATKLGLLAPPSSMEPSDLPGGAAYDLRALAPQVDRVRLLTVDLSCCGSGPGATTDSSWIAGVLTLAATRTGGTALSYTLPLYGTAFGPGQGDERPVGFLEALGLAGLYQVQIQRAPEGALHFDYTDGLGARRSVWFDDTRSLTGYQRALDATLSPSIGVFYYGLGAEDPALWGSLSRP